MEPVFTRRASGAAGTVGALVVPPPPTRTAPVNGCWTTSPNRASPGGSYRTAPGRLHRHYVASPLTPTGSPARSRGRGRKLINDLQAVFVVPLLSDLDEAVLRCQLVGSQVVGADGDPNRMNLRLLGGALQQGFERRAGIATSPVRRVNGVSDLHHPRCVRRPVIAGPTHRQMPLFVPDNAGHPRRAGRVFPNLTATHLPHTSPVRAGKVGREGNRTGPVRRHQVTLGESPERRAIQMHDAHCPRRATPESTLLMVMGHRATLSLARWTWRAGWASALSQHPQFGCQIRTLRTVGGTTQGIGCRCDRVRHGEASGPLAGLS